MKVKQAMPSSKKKIVIYEIPCKDCPCVYIGETGRTLEKDEAVGSLLCAGMMYQMFQHPWNICHTVHVTSYLNFSAEIRTLPSRNSVNVCETFRRVSAPALQTGCENVPTAEHFPRNTVVSRGRRDRFHPPRKSDLAT